MSLLVNTPDSDNQLVRSALHEWTVFRLTCSLHSVHFSLLPEQGKAAEVYFTSEHSFMDLRCATSLRTDECDIIYVCKYIQFKFTSRTLQCTMNGIRSLRTGIMEEYRVMSTSQGTCVRIEQTSEVIRVTYEMCRAVGREDWNWEPLPYTYPTPKLSPHRRRCISTFPPKTQTVWFISILNYGDTEIVLINHLLLVIPVIPMSLYKFVSS